ncbi:MAG: twin-arginine translocation signal domain-containing protein, partial [Planctomycetota bacterium]
MTDHRSRRDFLQWTAAVAAAATGFGSAPAGEFGISDPPEPQSVQELWAGFDPRKEPLETELIREWREGGCVYRHVRFLVGTFRGVPARMTAIYGFPEQPRERLPAVMHNHGGGQRGFLHEV